MDRVASAFSSRTPRARRGLRERPIKAQDELGFKGAVREELNARAGADGIPPMQAWAGDVHRFFGLEARLECFHDLSNLAKPNCIYGLGWTFAASPAPVVCQSLAEVALGPRGIVRVQRD